MFYPVCQQVSKQGSQWNKNVLSWSQTSLSTLLLYFYSVEKRSYSVENLVEKLVGKQDKTHEFSPCLCDFQTHSIFQIWVNPRLRGYFFTNFGVKQITSMILTKI